MPHHITAAAPQFNITEADIEALIASVQFVTSDDIDAVSGEVSPMPSVMTVCVITLDDGEAVTAEVQCRDPGAYDAETGRQLARDKAMRKLWGQRENLIRRRAVQGQVAG